MIEIGTSVRVREMSPPGHIRTPKYLRGKSGVVERVLGPFKNPEQLAYNLPAAAHPLYRVRFKLSDLWPGEHSNNDTLDAEIYAHWVEEI